ncbi:MAG: helix-hairpin-helix domain-containing protein [Acidobacteria bacterium]|nr:helix-hairpin-helix domain-containing protein [Acidobacteriota bacterium]OQB57978.1 MAG: ComE operon protein 1 [Candidatus Aminicenantes bacterium ADurb.Bin147]HNT32814.1 helix-hairpin-helix domain-containing protein [Candidatus Aminicenantes bacterium]HOY98538.1 helix-hairpin-helix domain-containing protein [Candidatus Aminicenantes bacterium]HPH43249.1 helix-hairpin-helix domain-containing protein [Candidatus Aminicenantes bacterium]
MKSLWMKGAVLGIIAALLVVPALAQQAAAAGGEKAAGGKINLNTAPLDELQKLPGVGAAIAQRIIDFRKMNGPFKKIEDLMKVRGIGEKLFLRFKDQLSV